MLQSHLFQLGQQSIGIVCRDINQHPLVPYLRNSVSRRERTNGAGLQKCLVFPVQGCETLAHLGQRSVITDQIIAVEVPLDLQPNVIGNAKRRHLARRHWGDQFGCVHSTRPTSQHQGAEQCRRCAAILWTHGTTSKKNVTNDGP
jgi:hypothetical protein